jgi:hypothetical protein
MILLGSTQAIALPASPSVSSKCDRSTKSFKPELLTLEQARSWITLQAVLQADVARRADATMLLFGNVKVKQHLLLALFLLDATIYP